MKDTCPEEITNAFGEYGRSSVVLKKKGDHSGTARHGANQVMDRQRKKGCMP